MTQALVPQFSSYGNLIAVTSTGQELTVPLNRHEIRVGRNPDNDLVLPDASQAEHEVLILCNPTGIQVIQLADSTQNILDGVVLQTDEPVPIQPDSVLSIGAARLFFYLDDEEQTEQELSHLGTLLIVDKDKRTQVLNVTTPTIRVGSASDNDILLDHSQAIAYQAQIMYSETGFAINDLQQGQTRPLAGWQQIGLLRIYGFTSAEKVSEDVLLSLPELQATRPVQPGPIPPPVAEDADEDIIDAEVIEDDQDLEALADNDSMVDLAAELAADDLVQQKPKSEQPKVPSLGTLVVVYPDETKRAAAITKPTIRLGNDPANDIILDHPSIDVFHLQLFCNPPEYQIFGLAKPLALDEAPIQPYTLVSLVDNSVLMVGDLRVYVYPPEIQIESLQTLAHGGKLTPHPAVEVVTAQEYANAQANSVRNHELTSLDLSPQHVWVVPGETTKTIVNLINHASTVDHIALNIRGLPLGWVSFSTPTLPLFPGLGGQIELLIHPPPEPSALAKVYPFTVEALSEHHPDQISQAQASLDVKAYTEFQVAIFPPLQTATRAANYSIHINNFSNQRHMFTVHCHDPEQGFFLPFTDRLIWLDPGATYQFNVQLRLKRRNWLKPEHTYPWSINVQSDNQYIEEAQAEFHHVPVIRIAKRLPRPSKQPQLPAPKTAIQRSQGDSRPLRLAPPTVMTPLAVAETVVLPLTPLAKPDQRSDEWVAPHMTVNPSMIRCEAGGTVTTTIVLTQRADVIDRWFFSIEGVPNAWVTLTPDQMSLLPNTRGEAQLVINPPRKAQSTAGKRTLRIVARSENFPDQTVIIPLVLMIQPFHEFRIEVQPAERKVRRSATFMVLVSNRGNEPQEYRLASEDPNQLIVFKFAPGIFTVEPGAVARSTMDARLHKRTFIGQPELYPFAIRAAAVDEPELVQETPARIVAKPRIPVWFVQLMVPFFMIIVAVAIATGRLNIRNFAQNLFRGDSSTSNLTASADPNALTDPVSGTTTITATSELFTATTPPVFLAGTNTWSLAESPVQLDTTYVLSPGASLQIESGVEVLVAPGASLQIYGDIVVAGIAGAPVRFNASGASEWGELALLNGSTAQISGLELRNAGSTGQALLIRSATTTMNDVLITQSMSGIRGYNALVNARNVSLVSNTFANRPTVAFEMILNNSVTLDGFVLRDNNLAPNSAAMHISVSQIQTSLTIRNSLLADQSLVGILIQAEQAYTAQINCNTITNASNAIALNDLGSAQTSEVQITDNSLGNSGTTGLYSAIPVQATANWWGAADGPESPQNTGSGSKLIGAAQAQPWAAEAPNCAPLP